jgi:hypothetical protein
MLTGSKQRGASELDRNPYTGAQSMRCAVPRLRAGPLQRWVSDERFTLTWPGILLNMDMSTILAVRWCFVASTQGTDTGLRADQGRCSIFSLVHSPSPARQSRRLGLRHGRNVTMASFIPCEGS